MPSIMTGRNLNSDQKISPAKIKWLLHPCIWFSAADFIAFKIVTLSFTDFKDEMTLKPNEPNDILGDIF